MRLLNISTPSEKRRQTLDVRRQNTLCSATSHLEFFSSFELSVRSRSRFFIFCLCPSFLLCFVLLFCFILSSISCALLFILNVIVIIFRGFSFVTVSSHIIFFFLQRQYFLFPLKNISYSYSDLHFLQALFLFSYFVAIFNVADLFNYLVI